MNKFTKHPPEIYAFICNAYVQNQNIPMRKIAALATKKFDKKVSADKVTMILAQKGLRSVKKNTVKNRVNPYHTQISCDYKILDLPKDLIKKMTTAEKTLTDKV